MNKIIPKVIGSYLNTLSGIAPEKATNIAFRLFSKPRNGLLLPNNLPKILRTSKIEYLKFNQLSFPIYQWKRGEEHVLLVHGWESNASRWEPFIKLLLKHDFSITCFDGPAHGMAQGDLFSIPEMAFFIKAIQDKFEIPNLIGHSVGGTASLYYQHSFQDKNLKKLSVLGAPSDLEKLVNNFHKLLGLNEKMKTNLNRHFEEKLNDKIQNFSGKIFTKNINLPGLIYHDEFDDVVLLEEAQKIAMHWQPSILKTTQGLGHSMHDEMMYLDIINWLKK